MGLGNNMFNDLKKQIIELDEDENGLNTGDKNARDEKIKDLYVDKEELEDKDANENLAKMILINDMERLTLIKEGKIEKAEEVARSNYEKSKKKRWTKKQDCGAIICLIFPIDEECGWDESFECKKGCNIHIRCEGLAPTNADGNFPDDYECRSCCLKLGNDIWLEEILAKEASKLTSNIHENSERLRRIIMKVDHLEHEDSQNGPRQKRLKESMKVLNLNPARYHGGDFEGKSIQDMLDCSRDKTFEIFKCISDKPDIFEKFKKALKILQQVSDVFKTSREDFTDEEIKKIERLCQMWGEHMPNAFPHMNVTPKAHDLVWVLPRILKEFKSFFMFYKIEQAGERIHSEMNQIQRQIWAIRNGHDRLWKYIYRYELRNALDISIVQPVKR